jgi:hypothetical protein
MTIKQLESVMLILLLTGMLTMTLGVAPRAIADENGMLDEIGTHFELQNFNITVTTGTTVHILLYACSPEMISYYIETTNDEVSTQVTIGYLNPLTTYYIFEDSPLNESPFTTDNIGTYTYTQDLSQRHHVFIQPLSSTTYIGTSTTLQADIYGDVVITASNIVLDLNGHSIIGNNNPWWFGIEADYLANVIIENGKISGFGLGMYLSDCRSMTLRNLKIYSNSHSDVEMSSLWDSLIVENTFASYTTLECGWSSSGNRIYHNNFMGAHVAFYYNTMPNAWDDGYPSGGNYWSWLVLADLYNGPNQDILGADGIGDSSYGLFTNNIDHYPLMYSWPRPHYELTVSIDPPGLFPAPSVDPPSPDGFYYAGTIVTLTANAVSGYAFESWEVNPPVAPQAQPDKVVITMDQDYTATAHYSFNLNIETGFKPGDSPSYASNPYLDDILCVLTKATGGYKLAGTSPGTFDYAIAIQNIGTTAFTSISININGQNDFCLHSQNPIRVLDASGSDITAQFETSGTWPTITISSKSTFTGLPAAGSLYVTVHLDYALKGHIFSSSMYSRGYTFTATVSGTSGANQGTKDASGSVALLSKKVTIIFGFVTARSLAVEGAEVYLYEGTRLLYSGFTDADGFYCFVDGVDGVTLTGGVTYKVSIAGFSTYTQTVKAVSNTAVSVNFKIPYFDP